MTQKKELEKQIDFLLLAALKKCGNLDEAQDLTQDTALAALSYLSKGNVIRDLKGWLITVMNRKFYYKLRQKYKITLVSIDSYSSITDDTDYFSDIIKTEEAENLRQSVAYLSKIHREVIVRHYMNGESIESIAQNLNIPQGTVKSRLWAGREQIKKEIEKVEKYNKHSYEPIKLYVANSGRPGLNGEPGSLVNNDLIAQNLLWLAYNEPATETDLSYAVGIPPAYVEPIIQKLVNNELMKRIGNKVYTDFIITTIDEQLKYILAQKQLVNENSELFLYSLKDALDKIRKIDCYMRFKKGQQDALELYCAFRYLDYGIYNAFSKAFNAHQEFIDRPNGGKWIAFGKMCSPISQDTAKDFGLELAKHNYAGERWTYLDNFMNSKFISVHAYDPLGFPVSIYSTSYGKSVIDDDDLTKLLWVIQSGTNPQETGFNVELLKNIPHLVKCRILRYDNDKPALDIPIMSQSEWQNVVGIMDMAIKNFVNDITETAHQFLKDKKQQLPKHLVSVPLQKQYMIGTSALTMAAIRQAIKEGLLHDGNYDDENQPPYPMIFISEN